MIDQELLTEEQQKERMKGEPAIIKRPPLAAIKERVSKATPGPFYSVDVGLGPCDSPWITLDGRASTAADRDLFAHAQADLALLLAFVQRLINEKENPR